MAWKYKDETCECGANLAGVEPIHPELYVTPVPLPEKSIADCPECWRTPEIVEVVPKTKGGRQAGITVEPELPK